MGWIKETAEDIGWFLSFSEMGWQRRTFFLCLFVLAFYFAVDGGAFGDSAKEFLTAHGLSLLNRVQIAPEVQVLDDPRRADAEIEINVTSSGFVKPSVEGATLRLTLQRTDRNPPVQSFAVRKDVKVDKQGFWTLRQPFVISDPGEYQIEYELVIHRRLIAATTKAVPGITPDSAFDSTFFVKPYLNREPTHETKNGHFAKRNEVRIFFLGRPNFSLTVFDELLLRLNPLLQSIELEIAPDPILPIENREASKENDEALISELKSAASAKAGDVKVGIYAGELMIMIMH